MVAPTNNVGRLDVVVLKVLHVTTVKDGFVELPEYLDHHRLGHRDLLGKCEKKWDEIRRQRR